MDDDEYAYLHLIGDFTDIPFRVRYNGSFKVHAGSPNEADALPCNFTAMGRVRHWSGEKSSISSLPDEIGHMTTLKVLDLYDNYLSAIPATISRCTALVKLHLANNEFMSFPREVCTLTNLRCLVLGDNAIPSIPAEIGNLRALTKLDMQQCNVVGALPEEICLCVNLEELDLAANRIERIPTNFSNLTALRVLRLGGNGLTVPSNIGRLINLKELAVVNTPSSYATGPSSYATGPECLPADFCNLTSLQHLRLVYTGLATLPDDIGRLSNLVSLNLGYNCLTTLPVSIGLLQSLTWVSFVNNRLTTMPPEIANLTAGIEVHTSRNPFVYVPLCVHAKGWFYDPQESSFEKVGARQRIVAREMHDPSSWLHYLVRDVQGLVWDYVLCEPVHIEPPGAQSPPRLARRTAQ